MQHCDIYYLEKSKFLFNYSNKIPPNKKFMNFYKMTLPRKSNTIDFLATIYKDGKKLQKIMLILY